ncbi:hypothetical protein B5X24_HaOG216737 [Helicoverpa armigera]|nr:hypothetical protein B5X24_HaOG216737 [Helicoverpa armigera]
MVLGEREWDAVASFCEAVMLKKETAERQKVLLERVMNVEHFRRLGLKLEKAGVAFKWFLPNLGSPNAPPLAVNSSLESCQPWRL